MPPTIGCGKQSAEHANLAGSKYHDVNLAGATFHDVNLTEADFNNVNLSRARLHDMNLSDLHVTAVQIGGSTFKHIGPPPCKGGKQARQRPVTFEEAMLCDSTFRKVDLSNVRLIDCNVEGITIDGVLVTDLLAAHRQQKP